jgi:hypothetical protein
MHDATQPLTIQRSQLLARSDAVLARSAAAWNLQTPHPPSIGRGGQARARGPLPFLSSKKSNDE